MGALAMGFMFPSERVLAPRPPSRNGACVFLRGGGARVGESAGVCAGGGGYPGHMFLTGQLDMRQGRMCNLLTTRDGRAVSANGGNAYVAPHRVGWVGGR